ncbi:MAG: copper-binding protein, partial [Candidatus Acidiferrales bacterium]
RETLRTKTNILWIFLLMPIFLSISSSGCGSSNPPPQTAQQEQGPKRYKLTGRVVAVDKPKLELTVDGDDIPGFMSPMTMPYSVKNAGQLDPLSPEDQIKADVVVNGNDVYLENIVVTKKPDTAKTPAAGGPPASSQSGK